MKYFFTVIALVSTLACPARTQRPPLQIRSMVVYQDTLRYGYSTGTALGHFDDLKTRHVPTITVSAAYMDRLSQVLSRAYDRKQHQTKLGSRLVFAEMNVATEKNTLHRFIISGTGESATMLRSGGQTGAVIVDLTSMRNYSVTDSADVLWLDALRTEIVGQQN